MNTLKERLKIYIEAIGLSVRDFEKSIGASNGYVNSIRKGVSTQALSKILEHYPTLNRDWLVYGEGEMLIQKEPPKQEARQIVSGYMVKQVPLVPFSARAGYTQEWNDPDFIDELETLPVLIDREWHGNYMVFEVIGDSMDDGSSNALLDRDFVLCREIDPILWKDSKLHIKKWKAFVIITREEGIVVKQIIDHDLHNNTITVHSLNDFYNDYEIDLVNVRQIFNVVQIISRQFRE